VNRFRLFLLVVGVFLFKSYAVFHCPFDEDELAFVRYSALLISGYLPFVDFIALATPLFHILLVPFVLPFRNVETVMFGTKILLLFTWTLGLYFFYRLVKIRFSTKSALWSTALFSLSYVFTMQNLVVRPPSFSLPLFFGFCWYLQVRKEPVPVGFKASAAALLVIVDPRMLPLLAALIVLPVFRDQDTRRLVKIFAGSFVAAAAVLVMPFHFRAPELILTLVRNVSGKYDQGILYSLRLIAGEWPLFLLSIYGVIELRSSGILREMRLGFCMVAVYAVIGWGVFSVLRPYTFWIYLTPFWALLAGLGMMRIERRYFLNVAAPFRGLIVFALLALLFANLAWWTRRTCASKSDLSLERQVEIQEEIVRVERRGGSVINLSRYSLNVLSPVTFPVLRIEEDIVRCTRKMGVNDFFFDRMKKILETHQPEMALFSEKDHFLRDDVFGYMVKHYRKDGEYLFRLKKEKERPDGRSVSTRRANRELCADFIAKAVSL
jgi:hypothetical protein